MKLSSVSGIITQKQPEVKCTWFTTYDLVSRGTDTAGQNECYGGWDETTRTGWGPGYQYACIHSGSTEHSGGPTVWYNYALASAGTIIDENTSSTNPANNMNAATESVCPSGWTLPTAKQTDNNRDTSSFSPVLGGNYGNGILSNEGTRGRWWGSTAYNGAARYLLYYDGSILYTGNGGRHSGLYIRCVSEEKAITSLTYMQDMTPEPLDYFLGLVDYRKASI